MDDVQHDTMSAFFTASAESTGVTSMLTFRHLFGVKLGIAQLGL
jgi:hypothetical protein